MTAASRRAPNSNGGPEASRAQRGRDAGPAAPLGLPPRSPVSAARPAPPGGGGQGGAGAVVPGRG